MRDCVKLVIIIAVIILILLVIVCILGKRKDDYHPSRNDHIGGQALDNVQTTFTNGVHVIVEDDALYAPQVGFGNELVSQNKMNNKFIDMFIASGGTLGRYPGGTPSNYWDWQTGGAISNANQCVYVNTNTDATAPIGSMGTLPLETCESGVPGLLNTSISATVGTGDRCWCTVNGDNISGYSNPGWALQNNYAANYTPGNTCELMCIDAAKVNNKIIDHRGPVISPGQCAMHCWNNPNCKSWQYKNPSISAYLGNRNPPSCWCKVNGENISGYSGLPAWALQNDYTGTAPDCKKLCADSIPAQYGNCILSASEATQSTNMTWCTGNNPGGWEILKNFSNKANAGETRSITCSNSSDCQTADKNNHIGNLSCMNFSLGTEAINATVCGECVWTITDWVNYVNAIRKIGGTIDTIFDLNILSSSMEYQLQMLDTAQAAGIPIKYIELGNEIYHNPDTANVYGNLGGRDKSGTYNADGSNYQIDMQRWIGVLKNRYPTAQIALVGSSSEEDSSFPEWNKGVFAYNNFPCINTSSSRMNNVRGPYGTCLTASAMMADAATIHIYVGLSSGSDGIGAINSNFQTIQSTIQANVYTITNTIPDHMYIWITEMAWYGVSEEYWMTGLCMAQLVIGFSLTPLIGSLAMSSNSFNPTLPIKTGIITTYSFISGNLGDALTMDTTQCKDPEKPQNNSSISFTWNGFIQSMIFNAFKTAGKNQVQLHTLSFNGYSSAQLVGCKLNMLGVDAQKGTGAIILNLTENTVTISYNSPLLSSQSMTWKAAYPATIPHVTSATPTIYTETGITTSNSAALVMKPYSIYISDPKNLTGFPSPNCTIAV